MVIVVTAHADGEGLRQELVCCEIDVKLGPGLVICLIVSSVHDDTGRNRDFGAGLRVQIGHGERRVEAPAIETEIHHLIDVISACGCEDRFAELDREVVDSPSELQRHKSDIGDIE